MTEARSAPVAGIDPGSRRTGRALVAGAHTSRPVVLAGHTRRGRAAWATARAKPQ